MVNGVTTNSLLEHWRVISFRGYHYSNAGCRLVETNLIFRRYQIWEWLKTIVSDYAVTKKILNSVLNILFSSYILKVPFENYSEDGIIYVWIGRYFSLTLCWMVCFHCFVLSLKLTWMFLLNKQQSLRKWSWSCQGTRKWNLGCKSENFSNLDLI